MDINKYNEFMFNQIFKLEPIEHCFDCGHQIPDRRYGGRCAHCAAIKYGVAEKREPEFQPRKEP